MILTADIVLLKVAVSAQTNSGVITSRAARVVIQTDVKLLTAEVQANLWNCSAQHRKKI